MVSSDRVQGVSGSLAVKAPVRAATTANITLLGLQTIDGVVLAADDRILVKDQTTGTENGIYVASTGAWQRARDFDGAYDSVAGTLIVVNEGATYGNAIWQVDADGTPGTDALTFSLSNTTNLAAMLASVANGQGASLVGVEDASTAWATRLGVPVTDVEQVLAEAAQWHLDQDTAINGNSEDIAANTVDIAANTAAIAALSAVGQIAFFAADTTPTNWLRANGAAVSRTTYAALFAYVGTVFGVGDGSTTFNLPDLRGEFLRGYDDGRGVDSGRVFGSAQADELKSHTHSSQQNATPTLAAGAAGQQDQAGGAATIANITATGGAETRPRNIALLACIRYQ